MFPYQSHNSFLGVPREQPRRFAFAGIPYDGAVTNRPGARFAPEAIRRASLMMCDATHPHFDVSPSYTLTDVGDLHLPNTSLVAAQAAIEEQAASLLSRHHMVWVGGDHSVTLSLLRAYARHHGRPLAIVHFDAHCDTWSDHFGEPAGHGTWTYQALQEGLLLPQATVQVGIRSAAVKDAREHVTRLGGRVFTARELRGCESPNQLAGVCDEIRQRMKSAGHPPVYLTLDIDCLDPAFAPGTGTPEPGGLTSNQVLTLIEELAGLNWVGMDCVEVCPPHDHGEMTSAAAATFVWTYLCGRLAHRPG
ncbi:agmatinase [Ramlibacter monticola]|uniref:Agmatinase n=1 Tax=Ramlibacter monticola TaxID=1926872 RepID=A0A936Z1J2_9BURK|nr:agmatinase [Ramlibacter monticola]MBL0393245.1 agmatinase [Ramlibacter monticola]